MALGALAAAPVGLLGAGASRLAGRPLGWGRRTRLRLWANAEAAREARDARIVAEHDERAAAASARENQPLPDAASAAERTGHDADLARGGSGTDSMMGGHGMGIFDFRGFAEDMYAAAVHGEAEGPGAMMGVLRAFEELPETLGYIARTFDVLIQRCDEELPLDSAVTAELEAIRAQMYQLTAGSSSVGETFRHRHDHDISRHEEPRTGEDLWDVGAGGGA
jgi:hypothetical protein